VSDVLTGPVRALLQAGDRAGALRACAALAQGHAQDADVASLHAYLLLGEGAFEQAVAEARRAVSLRPDSAPMRANLARTLMYKGTVEEALAVVDGAKGLAPQWAELCSLEGEIATHFGRFMEAVRRGREALAKFPGNVELLYNLALALHATGQNAEAVGLLEGAIMRLPTDLRLLGTAAFLSNYVDTLSAEQVLEAHRRYGKVLTRHYPAPSGGVAGGPAAGARGGRRVRVGVLSPDLREHSVAFFARALLEHVDRSKIELFAYSTQKSGDAMTGVLRGLPEHWRDVPASSLDGVVAAIRADGLDLLIELAGHTKGGILPVVHRRVAVKHASYLGYPNTTGIAGMQFRLVDSLTDPVGSEWMATEKLVRLDPCFLCFSPPTGSPAVGEGACVSRGTVTFGSFNTVKKISDSTVRLWSGVLKRVPGARLLLKSHGFDEPAMREHVRGRFEAQGVEGARVEFLGPVQETAGHLAVYGQVDIALDTYPYHGTTTTCEALWMGVPVVTLAGDRHASRVGVSLLTNVGLPELVARSEAEFVDIAAGLAGDGARLRTLRGGLRGMVERSPLMDGPGFARRFERAVVEMVGE